MNDSDQAATPATSRDTMKHVSKVQGHELDHK
jgi:hypothetical protein